VIGQQRRYEHSRVAHVDRVLHDHVLHFLGAPEVVRHERRRYVRHLGHVDPPYEPIVASLSCRFERSIEDLPVSNVSVESH
jgi:hypothetical protein